MATSLNLVQDDYETAVEMALDKCVLLGTAVTISSTPTPAKVVTGWDIARDGALSSAVPASGHIVAGRTGTAIITITGSFENTGTGSSDITGLIYLNTGSTGYGFQRDITGTGLGSFAGRYAGPVTVLDEISLYLSDSNSKTYNFSYITISLEWIN